MKELAFSGIWYWLLLGVVVSYFLGCFNFAVLFSRRKNQDIRQEGSGNPGTMNMARTFGIGIGFLTMFWDCLKAVIPVLCGYFIFRNYVFAGTGVLVSDFTRYLFGVSAIVGHIFPVTMRFKGGKGIASTVGMFWAALSCEYWWFSLVVLLGVVFVFLYLYIWEWGSMGSLMIVGGCTIAQGIIFVLNYSGSLRNVWVILSLMLLLLVDVLTWTAHRRNLYDLLGGEEHHTSIKAMLRRHQKTAEAKE